MNLKIEKFCVILFYITLFSFYQQTLAEYTFVKSSILLEGTSPIYKNNNLFLSKWNNIETKYGFFEGNAIWISDKSSIYGLTILLNPGKYSTKTDYDGNFKIQLPYGKYKVDFYFLNHLLKTDYLIINSDIFKSQYSIPDLPNLTTLEVKSSI